MNPILYSTITEGTVPTHYGVGVLDCISCQVHEERNGPFELTMEYASEGIHASGIVPNAILKVKPNYTDNPQLFRIYKIGKTINGRFEVNAQHISYDLSGKIITSGDAIGVASACSLLEAAASPFTITTSKTTLGNFRITEPSSVRSWFGGKEGSLLDVYGGGEWKYDNYSAKLWQDRGADRGVTIRYGKNLTELSQEIDISNLCTGVVPYYKDANGIVTTGTKVSTGLVSDVNKDLAIDFSQEVNPESADDIPTQLAALATAYVASHNFVTAKNNITLDFVQLKGLTERIDLCDTVHIYFEPLGISASMKCISTTWDCLEERYIETEFGDPKQSITDTISENTTSIAEASAEAGEAVNIASGKARVFITTPEPPYDIGDIWTDSNDIYYCTTPRAETITGNGSGAVVSFNTLIGGSLTGCSVDIEGSQPGSGTPSPLNPRPLTAYTEANVAISGKNLVFKTLSDANIGGTGTIASAVGYSDLQVARVVEGETYAIKTDAGQFIGGFFTSEPSIGSTTYDGQRIVQNAQTFTAPITGFVVFRTTNGYASPQLELGSTSTDFEAYEGEVFSISFDTAGTVYKGTLNVLTGELSVTHKVITRKWSQFGGKTSIGTNTRGSMNITSEGVGIKNHPSDICNIAPYLYSWASDTNHFYIDTPTAETCSLFVFLPNGTDGDTEVVVAYELATPATFNLTPQEIVSAIGNNVIFANTGDISISYFVDGFTMNDWTLASDYVSQSSLEDAIANASDIITGTRGGYVVLHDADGDGNPDEILIMDKPDINTATEVWRWNKGGLGFANQYDSLDYAIALTHDGQIVADRITTGSLDASKVTIQHLTASMFEGHKITLGGLNNTSGVFELRNEQNIVIGEMDKDGLKFYGAGPEGARPYVLLNNQVGFAGYDANDNPLFWVNRDEFTMEKCVARKEISACNKIRFIPITLTDENDQIINDGVAIVALIESGV